ncbi:MAG: asparaginase [Flavobacteriales bacterium]|nr:asparaginase [Flavobacteriales bacterium]
MSDQRSVLLIYTGGTIGMLADPRTGELRPMDMAHLEDQVPELARMGVRLEAFSFEVPMDSSDIGPDHQVRIASIIGEHYDRFDGFVVLHGSDTMAFTASALSFLLEGLSKPVILTGSQLPVGVIRTDARENLVTAIEIAAACDQEGRAMVPEVAIYFEYTLLRGNRTVKVDAQRFEAFRSPNWPALAEAGVRIRYNKAAILEQSNVALKVHSKMDDRLAVIRLYPGIRPDWLRHALAMPDLRAAIITTFGSGNGPSGGDFLKALREARGRGVELLNVTQCIGGRVEQGRYTTSVAFRDMGVVPCADMTLEAAVSKAMFLMARSTGPDWTRDMGSILAGEFTMA